MRACAPANHLREENKLAKITTQNQTDFSGTYGTEAEPITFASNLVSTTIISGLTAVLSADKKYWVNGPLTYTVVITNNSGDVYSKGVLVDNLDTANVSFDADYGVEIGGEKTTDYTISGGTLSVNLPDIADEGTLTVSFRVTQA